MANKKSKENKEKDKGLHPLSKFRHEYIDQAYKLSLLGLTTDEMALFFEVGTATIEDWKRKHPEFWQAIKDGGLIADMRIVKSLYDTALDRTVEDEQCFKVRDEYGNESIETIKVRRTIPADHRSISLWLRNRQPKKWRDKQPEEQQTLQNLPVANIVVNIPENVPPIARDEKDVKE